MVSHSPLCWAPARSSFLCLLFLFTTYSETHLFSASEVNPIMEEYDELCSLCTYIVSSSKRGKYHWTFYFLSRIPSSKLLSFIFLSIGTEKEIFITSLFYFNGKVCSTHGPNLNLKLIREVTAINGKFLYSSP